MKKHRIFTIYMGNSDGANKINEYLDKGWLVKDIKTISDESDCYAIVVIEKEED